MRKAQDKLLGDVDRSAGNVDDSVEASSAATAFKDDRLTFVWLDGEVQKVDCFIISITIYLLLSLVIFGIGSYPVWNVISC